MWCGFQGGVPVTESGIFVTEHPETSINLKLVSRWGMPAACPGKLGRFKALGHHAFLCRPFGKDPKRFGSEKKPETPLVSGGPGRVHYMVGTRGVGEMLLSGACEFFCMFHGWAHEVGYTSHPHHLGWQHGGGCASALSSLSPCTPPMGADGRDRPCCGGECQRPCPLGHHGG